VVEIYIEPGVIPTAGLHPFDATKTEIDEEELGEGEIIGLLGAYGDGLHQRAIDAICPLSIT